MLHFVGMSFQDSKFALTLGHVSHLGRYVEHS